MTSLHGEDSLKRGSCIAKACGIAALLIVVGGYMVRLDPAHNLNGLYWQPCWAFMDAFGRPPDGPMELFARLPEDEVRSIQTNLRTYGASMAFMTLGPKRMIVYLRYNTFTGPADYWEEVNLDNVPKGWRPYFKMGPKVKQGQPGMGLP